MLILDHLWIIIALPLLGAAINGLLGKNWSKPVVNSVAIGSVSLAFLCVVEAGSRILRSFPPDRFPGSADYFTWITAGHFKVDFSLQVDQLTIVMLLRGHLRQLAGAHLFHRLHGARRGLLPLLQPT